MSRNPVEVLSEYLHQAGLPVDEAVLERWRTHCNELVRPVVDGNSVDASAAPKDGRSPGVPLTKGRLAAFFARWAP